MVMKHPKIASHKDQESLNSRQDIVLGAVPRLGLEAAEKAIKEWGQPRSKITHLIFHTTTGSIGMPRADRQMLRLLDLPSSVKRSMMYHQNCSDGGTMLHLANDIAENTRGTRVLVICSEIALMAFCGPSEGNLDTLLPQAIFGDGAAAVIVGSDPDLFTVHPIYNIICAGQNILPGAKDAFIGHIRQDSLTLYMSPPVPELITGRITDTLAEIVGPLRIINEWNAAFWAVNPSLPIILEKAESDLKLDKEKLKVTRHVLADYGNMMSAIIFFMLEEMRKQSVGEGMVTVVGGMEFEILLGFGAGMTIETTVFRANANTTSQVEYDDLWTI